MTYGYEFFVKKFLIIKFCDVILEVTTHKRCDKKIILLSPKNLKGSMCRHNITSTFKDNFKRNLLLFQLVKSNILSPTKHES